MNYLEIYFVKSRANKEHVCQTCKGKIRFGEYYHKDRSTWDGEKMCSDCFDKEEMSLKEQVPNGQA